MSPPGRVVEDPETPKGVFATTHWSVVLAAGQPDSPRAAAALEQLCRTYWYPLYASLRRRGYGHLDAQDLTQGFLAQLLEHQAFTRVTPERGRFRSFLLAGLNYYVADQRDRATARKRGSGQVAISLDALAAQERYRLEPVDNDSPDRVFARHWARTMLDQVFQRLEQEFQAEGRSAQFQQLQVFVMADRGEASYAEAAGSLGMNVDAVRKAAQRLRQRYYELFREEIAHTLAQPGEVEEELRYLCEVMAT